jgi:hypothetical protein
MLPFIISFLIALTQKRVTLLVHGLVGTIVWCFLTYSTVHAEIYERVHNWIRTDELLNNHPEILGTAFLCTAIEVSVACGLAALINLEGRRCKKLEAKNQSTDDSDPRTIKINWLETVTPTQGITWLTIPSGRTTNMDDVPYGQQCWMRFSGGVVMPLFTGSLVVTEPISARSS